MFVLLIVMAPVALVVAVVSVVSVAASLVALTHALVPVAKVPIKYNLRNLQSRWLTTLATGLAFTIVVGLVTAMLAFVRGMDRITDTSGVPGNVMILSDGAVDETMSNLPNASIEELPGDMQAAIQKMPGSKRYLATKEVYVVAVYTVPNVADGPNKRRFVQMRGLDDMAAAALIHGIELDKGAWLSPSGVRELTNPKAGTSEQSLPLLGPSSVAASGSLFGQGAVLGTCMLSYGTRARPTAKEIILGSGIAKTFGMDVGKDSLVPGDLVQIGPVSWYVAGIMKENNSSYGSEIWALDSHVQGTFGRGLGSYSSFVARTRSEKIGSKAAKELRDNRSGLRSYNAFTEQEYFAKLTAANVGMRYTILIIAVVITIAGALGVMITMFAAISQRSKDIGVLRLLGFTRFQILCSFMVESLVIAALGGLVGLAAGYWFGDGQIVNSIVGGQGGGGKSVVFRTTVDVSVLVSAGLLTFLMGAVGGFLPAVSAMRLRPLESLR